MSAEVRVVRGPLVESEHLLAVAVADPEGQRRWRAGPADRPVFLRSAAKPFQALPLVMAGGMERLGLDDRTLAVICSSHSGTPEHVAVVEELLARLDLGPEALLCGADAPLHEPSARVLWARGQTPTALHHNCSGKHAGMLALARLLGAPTEEYIHPDHPVQRAIRQAVARCAGLDPEALAVGVDGCSAPVWGMPLEAMARAFARLARPQSLDPETAQALERIGRAMAAHPQLVAGPRRFDTALMEASRGQVVSKSGAEGVQGVAWGAGGLGVAVKAWDGASRASAPMALAALESLGALEPAAQAALEDWRRPVLRNAAGRTVGRIETFLTWEVWGQ